MIVKLGRASVILMACGLLTAWIGSGQNSVLQPNKPGYFPQIQGADLHGEARILPQDFAKNPLNLVVVAFERKQQSQANSWIEHHKTLKQSYSGLAFFEIPLLYEMGRSRRFTVNNGMRSKIRKPAARSKTIVIYTDRDVFLDYMDMDTSYIYPLLIDRNGRILWRGVGIADAQNQAALKSAIVKSAASKSS